MLKSSAFYVIEGQRQGVSLADKMLLADKDSLPLRSGRRYCSKVATPIKKYQLKKMLNMNSVKKTDKKEVRTSRLRGKKTALAPAIYRYTIRFTGEEYDRFLHLFEQSGMKRKSSFIRKRIFLEPFKVITIDKAGVDYYNKLTETVALFRSLGVNYNQVVKMMHTRYSDKVAWTLLEKLELITSELMEVGNEIKTQNEAFKQWLQR